jgi:hypothetical protein
VTAVTLPVPAADRVHVTAVEIAPCRVVTCPDGPPFTIEPCAPAEAEFWTVYGRMTDGTVQAATDHETPWLAMVAATAYAADLAAGGPALPVTITDPTTGRAVDVRRTT